MSIQGFFFSATALIHIMEHILEPKILPYCTKNSRALCKDL